MINGYLVHYRASSKDWIPVVRKPESKDIWVFKRIFHVNPEMYLGWIETKGGLREPTPAPMCLKYELKEGFHFHEFVH